MNAAKPDPLRMVGGKVPTGGSTGELRPPAGGSRPPRRIIDAAAAALYANVAPATIRSWTRRPSTGVRHYRGGYSLDEIDNYLARRNPRMIRHRAVA